MLWIQMTFASFCIYLANSYWNNIASPTALYLTIGLMCTIFILAYDGWSDSLKFLFVHILLGLFYSFMWLIYYAAYVYKWIRNIV